jgi:hypothetical protein
MIISLKNRLFQLNTDHIISSLYKHTSLFLDIQVSRLIKTGTSEHILDIQVSRLNRAHTGHKGFRTGHTGFQTNK